MIALALILATVTGSQPPASYSCTGATTVYTVPFPYLAASQVSVIQTTAAGVATTLTQPAGYSVKPSIAPSTGTVTLVTACPSGSTLTISRAVPLTQPQSFRTGAYSGPAHEQSFDRLEMQIQQVQAGVANPVLPSALTNATPVTARGTTTAQQLQDWLLLQGISVKGEGAVGDGIANDAAAFQAAASLAQANNGTVLIPCGTYIINSTISMTPTYFGITFQGAATNCVIVKAGAAMTSMFSFTDTSQNGRFTFKNISLDGNALAQYGIKSTKLAYSKFERVDIRGTSVAAIQIQDGWDNTFRDCELHDNTGDGLVTAGNANDVTVINSLFSNNTGWGIKTNGGGPFAIRGGAVQVNGKGGIYSVTGARPLVVDGVYFEQNALTGFAFTTPVKTVKADILLNGSGVETTMSHGFPTPTASVRNCLHNATYSEAFIYAAGVSALAVTNNFESSTAVSMVKTYGDNAFALASYVRSEGNSGFAKEFDVESVTSSRSLSFSTFFSDTVQQRNYLANKNVYSLLRFGASATIARGATKYNGRETFDVSGTAGDTFGITIDTTATTELANTLVYISAWAKSSSTAAGPRVAIGAKVNTASVAADLLWHHIEFADFMPAAGTVNIGFGKLGAVGGDVVTFADVVVAVVGAPDRGFHRDTLPPAWSFTAAPTTGTWAVGDRVYNSVPAVGAPKSWVCTVAGTPGTWVSEGNL